MARGGVPASIAKGLFMRFFEYCIDMGDNRVFVIETYSSARWLPAPGGVSGAMVYALHSHGRIGRLSWESASRRLRGAVKVSRDEAFKAARFHKGRRGLFFRRLPGEGLSQI